MNGIHIKGARQNNLKNIDVDLPENAVTVFTGVSGSGKSSLAYDVIYAEGQRRFLQSMNSSLQGMANNMMKPEVDIITGLSPVISISQRKSNLNPRSTVASVADLSNYIRLLFAITGKAFCPYCGMEIKSYSVGQIAENLLNNEKDRQISLYAPAFKRHGETYAEMLTRLYSLGYKSIIFDGKEYAEEPIEPELAHTVEVFIGKVRVSKSNYDKLLALLDKALLAGGNFVRIEGGSGADGCTFCEHRMVAGAFYHKDFSPNDLSGACPACEGLGRTKVTEPKLLIKDDRKTLRENPLYVSQFAINDQNGRARLLSLAAHYGFSIDTPFCDLREAVKNLLFHGTNGEKYEILQPDGTHAANPRYTAYEGLCKYVDRMHKKKAFLPNNGDDALFTTVACPDCGGSGIRKERTYVRINGKSIREVNRMSITELILFMEACVTEDAPAGGNILKEILAKLRILEDIGLGYLSPDRRTDTLSGGEYQRIRIASQIGSELKGITYIIDEPTTGLHAKDTHKIIEILQKLKAAGNTVLVVEHAPEVIRQADYIVEMGPGAGSEGGYVIAAGSVGDICADGNSIIGKYLNGTTGIALPSERRTGNGKFISVYGASENNLKNIDVKLPLGMFVCITGVSGSGKSTFMNQVLYKAISSKLLDKRIIPGKHDRIEGMENIKGIRYINQSPIGKSARSNPCTYLGIYTHIRTLFASTQAAKDKNYDAGFFSFNNRGGRCENCFGEGTVVVELKFMQDMTSVCPVCNGKRFTNELLSVHYKGLNIYEVLNLTVKDALDFFAGEEAVYSYLEIMDKLGLGYLKLGQSTSTLSGGESQRLKLAKELGRQRAEEDIVYILDEPTSGLHEKDIEAFLGCIRQIVEHNNTVVVIEHNLNVIKTADYVIDFGPEAGNKGGYIVAQGTPEAIAGSDGSYTGMYLRKAGVKTV